MECIIVLVLLAIAGVTLPTIVAALYASGRRPWPTQHPAVPLCPHCGKPLKPFVEGCHHCGASFR